MSWLKSFRKAHGAAAQVARLGAARPSRADAAGASGRARAPFAAPAAVALAAVVLATLLSPPRAVPAQDAGGGDKAAAEEVPLLEQEPHDVITLDAANKNARLPVFTIPFPGRKKPSNPDPNSKLTVRLISNEKIYEVFWRNIVRVDLFEELLLREAERLRDAKKFDEAFEYYFKLRNEYPNVTGLQASIDRYLYDDARQLAAQGRLPESLGVLEELYDRNRNFKLSPSAPPLVTSIGGLLERLIKQYVDAQDWGSARRMIQRTTKRYGRDKPASIDDWSRQLADKAQEFHDQAVALLEKQSYHEAIEASHRMMEIWPDLPGAAELNARISAQYPLVAVGVLQPALTYDSLRMDNWAARRTGRLVHHTLVEFLGTGGTGGRYSFTLGDVQRSEDQSRLIFNLSLAGGDELPLTGHHVARRLLEMADPASQQYLPAWGGVMGAAQVNTTQQLEVELRHPHVLPEALLRVPIDPAVVADPTAQGNGPFEVGARDERKTSFLVKDFAPNARLAELVERYFDDTQQALAALRRGEIDVVDRLFPADAARLGEDLPLDSPIAVEQYALPTIHMLLLNTDNAFLANREFRRAIVFAINREMILHQELLSNREIKGCRVISGPFAAGIVDNDPLAYAYDLSVEPRGYFPRLGKLLTIVAQQQVEEMAEKRGETAPELGKLVLGHPKSEAARLACQAISAHLKLIGLEIELKEFPPGVTRDPDGQVDLTYAEIAVWEPVVDARRLLGDDGLSSIDSPYLRRALRELDKAQTWSDVRERLVDLHRTAHNEVAVVPLWQMTDSFAYRKRLRNIRGDSPPVWLYQNVDQWRLGSGGVAE